jgi:transposase
MGKIERIQVSPESRERLCELVKDRNTPQKIVWRSQIVLLAGEGIGAVDVATRVCKSVLTVRRWRRRYAAKGGGRLAERRYPSARARAADGEENQASREPDAQREAAGRHPLERTQYGGTGRHRAVVGPQDLGCARAQAASDENLQALARSGLRRQGRGYRRALPRSARQGPGAGGR